MLRSARTTLFALSVLVLMLVLGACAAPATPAVEQAQPAVEAPAVEAVEAPAVEAAAPAAETAAPAAEAMDGGAFSFTAWALNEGASRDVVMGYIEAYDAATGASITDVAFPWGETLNQLVLQASSNTGDGAAQLDIAWLNTLAATGKLKDLSAYTEGRDYQGAALASGQVDGVQYGLPWTTGSIGMVANQQILDAAGVTELPTTIAEFEAALEKIKAYDADIVPYAGMTSLDGLKDIIPWIWTFGGTIIDADGNVTLGDEGSVAALEWYKSMLDKGYMAPEMDRFTARQLFSQGKTAFFDDAIVVKGIVTKDTPIENLGDLLVSVPRPVLAAGDAPQSLLWGHIVVVFEGENGDAAAKFAQYLTSDPATTLNYFETMSLPPTTVPVLESEAVQNDKFISAWATKVTATARTNPFWPYAESARLESILAEQAQAYLVGAEASAKTALDYANADITDIIK